MIIAVKILGAAEGLRPRDIILAYALAANTAHGASMQKLKTMVNARFLSISTLLYGNSYIILFDLSCSPKNWERLVVDFDSSFQKAAQRALVKWQDFKHAVIAGQYHPFCLAFKQYFCIAYDSDF